MKIDFTMPELAFIDSFCENSSFKGGTMEVAQLALAAATIRLKIGQALQTEQAAVPGEQGVAPAPDVTPDTEKKEGDPATNGKITKAGALAQAPLSKRTSRHKPLASAAKK
jgi:hypothetical protein